MQGQELFLGILVIFVVVDERLRRRQQRRAVGEGQGDVSVERLRRGHRGRLAARAHDSEAHREPGEGEHRRRDEVRLFVERMQVLQPQFRSADVAGTSRPLPSRQQALSLHCAALSDAVRVAVPAEAARQRTPRPVATASKGRHGGCQADEEEEAEEYETMSRLVAF